MTPQELIARAGELISLPRAYHRITEMLDDPRYGPVEIGHVVAHEPALTARVLRLVNSAALRLPQKIDSVPLAISVLGTRKLRDLLLATSVATTFSRINTKLVDVADFWHHSLYTGILARLLGKQLKQHNDEQLFIGGLLHDLGKLVIYHQLPEQASRILGEVRRSQLPVILIEQEHVGFDHAQVGAALLESWQLPELYVEIAAHHHAPEDSSSYSAEVGLVHLANVLSHTVEPGHKLGPDSLPDAQPLHGLGTETVEELLLTADVQSVELFTTLFSGTAAPAPA